MSQTTSPTLKGQCIAEFLGTGLLIFFGVGCVAALKLAGASFGQWEISIIWGLGVAMAIYLTAAISGAHLNPAVTIALWLFACFDRRKVLPTSSRRLPAPSAPRRWFMGFTTICSMILKPAITWCAAA